MIVAAIGIGGNHGLGKSTLAKSLESIIEANNPNTKVKRFAFADRLKSECKEIYRDRIPGGAWYKKPTDPNIRRILVGYGNYRRSEDPYYWVNALDEVICAYENIFADTKLVVIVDDIRYINEANYIREQLKGYNVLLKDVDTEKEFIADDEVSVIESYCHTVATISPENNLYLDPAIMYAMSKEFFKNAI